MPLKESGSPNAEVVDRFAGGVGWIAHPQETMRRTSHALVGEDGGVWIVDPVDAPAVDDLVAEYGEVAGVVVLLDRHLRDAATVATRHDVPVSVPEWMGGVSGDLAAPVARFAGELAGFAVGRLVDSPLWQEAILYDGETLVVPEAVGTISYFCAPGEPVGVHPVLRPLPPWSLLEYDPERLLVGHGRGRLEGAAEAVQDAVRGARRRMISLYLQTFRSMAGRKKRR